MKVVSWNINDDYRDLNNKVSKIIELLSDADVVGLQEVRPDVYDILYNKLKDSYVISEKQDGSFFNVLISRFMYPMVTTKFTNTRMNRGFITQKTDNMTFITTHLESGHMNKATRELQVKEITANISGQVTIFGDMNFTHDDEKFGSLRYLKHTNNNIYTYDSQLNRNAMPPYRSNLDRFYINSSSNIDSVEILTDYKESDHFPIKLKKM